MPEEFSVLEYEGIPKAALDQPDAFTSGEYQTIVSWTVTEGYQGVLEEVAFMTSNYLVTQFKLVIAGTTEFEDKKVGAACNLPWESGNKLDSESVVTLYAKSDGITSVTVTASITGKILTMGR